MAEERDGVKEYSLKLKVKRGRAGEIATKMQRGEEEKRKGGEGSRSNN